MSPNEPSVNGGVHSHDEVAARLRERIHSGALSPGDSLPTQKELMAEFGVPRGVIRQALARLKEERLLTDVTKGSPPTVARSQDTHSHIAQPASAELADRIRHAFQARHVTIDAYCLTSETLNQALASAVIELEKGTIEPPESVTARVIVPDADAGLALPQLVGTPQDTRPHERLKELIQLRTDALQGALRPLVEQGSIARVSMDVRLVAITPMYKMYLLNKSECLMAHYVVTQRTVKHHRHSDMEIYDVEGVDARTFRFSTEGDAAGLGAQFVQESQRLFDSIWNSISQPMEPN